MSYDIYIGEPEIKYYPEEEYMKIGIKRETHPDAPDLGWGDISGKGNSRHPGYCQMADWCRTVGLYDLFFDEESGLLRSHPGCRPLLPKHLEEVRQALKLWEEKNPGCKEKFPSEDKFPSNYKDLNYDEQTKIDEQFDWMYARLVWYEFWFDWALKNCKMPSIKNG